MKMVKTFGACILVLALLSASVGALASLGSVRGPGRFPERLYGWDAFLWAGGVSFVFGVAILIIFAVTLWLINKFLD